MTGYRVVNGYFKTCRYAYLLNKCINTATHICYNQSDIIATVAVIENVITDQDHRNMSIGKAVMRYAINRAWEAGCYKVMLLTGRKEESTLEFYRSCGLKSGLKTAFIAKRV